MSELVALCDALDHAIQPLPSLAAGLQQRASRLQSLAVEIQIAARELPAGPDCARVAAALYEAKSRLEMSATALDAAFQQGRSYIQRTVGDAGSAPRVTHASPMVDSTASGRPGVHTVPGLPPGCVLVSVELIDQTESPINGPEDFTKGYSPEDLSHAFDMLEREILPALAGGAGREAFEAMDSASGVYGTRSLTDTYSGFLDESGHNVIKLTLGPNGKYTIDNGRHRIWVASQDGRPFVPAFIS